MEVIIVPHLLPFRVYLLVCYGQKLFQKTWSKPWSTLSIYFCWVQKPFHRMFVAEANIRLIWFWLLLPTYPLLYLFLFLMKCIWRVDKSVNKLVSYFSCPTCINLLLLFTNTSQSFVNVSAIQNLLLLVLNNISRGSNVWHDTIQINFLIKID